MEKILVTGGAGYAGSILVPKLISNGFDVRVLDSMIFGSHGLDTVKNKCEIINGDIRDSKLVKKCLEGVDSVIHLAAISNDPCSDLNPELTEQVNFGGTKTLVECSKKMNVKRFINVSTSSVYGIKKEQNVTEDLSLEPLTIYSETKARAEEIVRKNNSSDFVTVNIRPATICGYSPRMRLDLTVNILTEQAINRGKITVFGGEQKRPNIHIEDITDYYLELLKIPKEKIAGETFNAGYENHTVMEIAELIKNVVGDVEIEITKTNDLRSYHISSEKIKDRLDLYPQHTIKDAVSDLKYAFSHGLIPNPSDTRYRNIARMKEIGIKNFNMNSITIPKEFNYISAFLTFRCNLACKYCLNTFEEDFSRKREELSGEQWIEALNRLETQIPITFTGGEPFIYRDFIDIIKNLKPELKLEILTNLYPNSENFKKTLERFVAEINPDRINRNVPYHSVRVSYHPEQMQNPEILIDNVKRLMQIGFKIGIYAVNSPLPEDAAKITQMQFRCLNEGVDFRIKDFVGLYEGKDKFERPFSILYGDYSKYPDSVFQEKNRGVLCRTPELLIAPNGNVFKCHRDLYSQEFPIGKITSPSFKAEYKFRKCSKYGDCHPCDVKSKTNHKQELGYTTVDIRGEK